MARGPAEPVPPPPSGLAAAPLPLARWERGRSVLRIHRLKHGPLHWSGGGGKPPAGRFDSPSGRFGVLYAAQDFAGAFAETVLRQPRQLLVSLAEIEARALSVLVIGADLALVDLTGPGLSQLGLDARMLSGPYETCGAWADALHDHPAQPDGILYPSRFDPSQPCMVFFDRAGRHLDAVTAPTPLSERLPEMAALLDRYVKALDPG